MLNTKPTTIAELYDVLMLRFDHTDALLDVIATTVNRHETKLDQHEGLLETLAQQSLHNMQVLDRLDPQVKVNGERLNYVELKVARLEFAK